VLYLVPLGGGSGNSLGGAPYFLGTRITCFIRQMKYNKYRAANYAVRAFLTQESASTDPEGADYDFKSICKGWDNKCAYCGEEGKLQREHLTGMNKDNGGLDIACNIVPACGVCNNYKQKHGYEATIRHRMDDKARQESHVLRIKEMTEEYERKIPLLWQKRIKERCVRIYTSVVNITDSECSATDTQHESTGIRTSISKGGRMDDFKKRGHRIRKDAKQLVLDLMNSDHRCEVSGPGMRQAEIFRECGFDWGNYPKATSSNQQYWVVALLKGLEGEGGVEQIKPSGPWRLK